MNAREDIVAHYGSGLSPTLELLLDVYRTEVLREAIEAARSEYLHDQTGDPEDEAYNRGVADAAAAIGALLETAGKDSLPAAAHPRNICWCGREVQPGDNHGMCYPGMGDE